MSALEDEKSYTRWINSKAVKLRRPTLDCGCTRRDGEATAGHIWCNRLACLDHADDPHDCSAFGGVGEAKDGTEEEAPEPAEAVTPVQGAYNHTTPWVSFADVAAGPVAGVDAAVDLRRRVQDGTAPVRDRITEAVRAEFLRQGITEYEEDDVRWVYVDGAWQVEALRPESYPVAFGIDVCADGSGAIAIVDSTGRFHVEPVSPLVDAAPEPEPSFRRYECPHPGCEWVKVTLDLDVFDGLLAQHERDAHAPAARLPWWKRWTR